MILISSYYLSNNNERQKELNECLLQNIKNKHIKSIILLNDKIYDLDFILKNKKKVKQIVLHNKEKLYFNDAIKYINDFYYGELIILSNTDIYFDDSLKVMKDINMQNKAFCLLRYDQTKDGEKNIFRHFDEPRSDSQDSWIFKAPLQIDLDQVDFSFGTLGCDNIFANVLYNHGILLSNPSYDIITTHVHNTEERNYDENTRIHGNYCLIKPDHLNNEAQIRFMNY